MFKIRVEGLREVDSALGELPRATRKNVVVRVLKKRAQPIAADMASRVTRWSGQLAEGIGVGTQLTKHQRSVSPKKSPVEVYAGAGNSPEAHLEEFGSLHNAPHPALRPAWDAGQQGALDGIGQDLWTEIDAARARLARKQARLIAKG